MKKPPSASGGAGGATITRPKGDPIVAEHLRKARAAYAAREYEEAKLHCNAVVGSTAASTAQVDEALLMRGTIYCKHLRNVGLAQGDIRSITSSGVRAQLRARCKL